MNRKGRPPFGASANFDDSEQDEVMNENQSGPAKRDPALCQLPNEKSNSNFSNLIIDVDSAFLDNSYIKSFLSNQILSDSQNINFNDLALGDDTTSHFGTVKNLRVHCMDENDLYLCLDQLRRIGF